MSGASHWGGTAHLPHLLTCSLVAFHPDPARLLLFSSATDAAIRIWSLQDQSCLAVLTAHYSTVTSLTFSADGHTMLRSAASYPGLSRQGRAMAETWELRWLFPPARAGTRSALSGTCGATRP